MKVLAITGGIGSGKSSVAGLFAQAGTGVVDLDAVGHFVLSLPEVKYDVARTFGAGVLDGAGEVSREKLAAAAFDTPEHVEWLNAITHPAIEAERERRVRELGKLHDVVCVEVTAGGADRAALPWADAVVAVSAPEAVRLARACSRRRQAEADVRARMAAQPTDAQREAAADYVLENVGGLDDLRPQVAAIMEALAGSPTASGASGDGLPCASGGGHEKRGL